MTARGAARSTGVGSSLADLPLEPTMPAIDGFRLVLADLAATIADSRQRIVEQPDAESLHELRIAVRRTRTVLAQAKGVLPAGVLGPARDGFGWIAQLTSTPRDLDVYLIEWSRYTEPLGPDATGPLDPVRAHLARRRAEGYVELERALRSERAAGVIGPWHTWLTEPLGADELPRRAGRPLGRRVAKRIARSHRIVIEHGRAIGPDATPSAVHDLRKDAKKLRYLVECFGSLLPSGPRQKYVKRLKALQDTLGEHQDAEVHESMLRAIASELDDTDDRPDTMIAIGRLTERLDQQRLAARAEFAERFADYDTRATQRALDAMLKTITA